MNHRVGEWIGLLSLFICVLALSLNTAGCGSYQRKERIQSHRHLYDTLSEEEQQLIEKGMIERGMTKAQVFLAMGVPEKIKRSVDLRGTAETWRYQKGRGPSYLLNFEKGVLTEIKQIIAEKPSLSEEMAKEALLEELDLEDVKPTTELLAEEASEGYVGELEVTITRRTSTGVIFYPVNQHVSLTPHYKAWDEAQDKIKRKRSLRSGLAKLMTLSALASKLQEATPSALLFKDKTDEEGKLIFSQVPVGRWMLTADLNDEDGLHLWLASVDIEPDTTAIISLTNENRAAAYPGPK